MGLIDQIENDYKQAFKSGQRIKVDMLRMLKSSIKNAEIAARHNLSDDEIIAVMTRDAKRRRDSIAMFKQAGRTDLVETEAAQLQELMYYLPTQYSDSELEDIVRRTIHDLSAGSKDFGKVMGAVMQKVKGQAEGERVSAVVKKLLGA